MAHENPTPTPQSDDDELAHLKDYAKFLAASIGRVKHAAHTSNRYPASASAQRYWETSVDELHLYEDSLAELLAARKARRK